MKRIKTPKPTPIQIGDLELTPMEFNDFPTRYTQRKYSVLNEEHSLGIIEGIEVWIGIEYLWNECPDPKDPTHAKHFRDYTKEELSRYKEWDSSVGEPYYRYKKNLHEKQRWGFIRITLASFANGIQIGDILIVEKFAEIGYAPSLNTYDIGDPIYLDQTKTIVHWVENNQQFIKDFAEERRIMALEFVGDTLKKLTK